MTTSGRGRTQARPGKPVIRQAAVDCFQQLGYHGTSMRDIAREAQVTVASIYHHFPAKQQILQDIMVGVLTDVIALTRGALLRAGPEPADQLRAVVLAWIRFHTSRRSEALIGASEIRSLDATGYAQVVALRDEQERMFRDIVDRGVAEGRFGTAYPTEATRAIITMGYSIAAWYRPGGPLAPEEMAQRYATLALATVEGVGAADPAGAAGERG